MRKSVRMVLVVAALVLAAGAGGAADKLESGPQPGKEIPGPFHPYNVTGPRAGKPHCLVCDYGLDPGVAIFARTVPTKPDAPLADLIKKLDDLIAKRPDVRLGAFVVFLNDAKETEREALIKSLEKLSAALKLQHVVLSIGPAAGPEGYDIDKDAEVTVLVYQKLEVKANFAFPRGTPLTAKDADTIAAEVQKLLPPEKERKRRARRTEAKPAETQKAEPKEKD
jgi:hypothetical protein